MIYKKLAYTVLIGAVLAPTSVAFAAFTDDIDAVDRNGRIIESVTVDDDVYVSGNCSAAAGESADIYVVASRSSWRDEDKLNDITDRVDRVEVDEDGELELTRVWFSRLDVGKYDIVADVDENGEFDEGFDCVDSERDTGFKVISKASGTASEGSKNPDEDFRWEPDEDDPFVTLLQVRLRVDDQEDVRIEGIELSSRGSGDDRNSILEVIIAEDRGNDGKYEDGRDPIWGIGKYERDGKRAVIEVNAVVEEKESVNIVIAYLMGKGLRDNETFAVSLTDIEATGLVTEGEVRFTGLSIRSIDMEVQGSGDAIEVKRDSDPPVVESNVGGSSSRTSPASSGSEDEPTESLLERIFSTDKDSEPWVPSPRLIIVFVSILGLLGGFVLFKLLLRHAVLIGNPAEANSPSHIWISVTYLFALGIIAYLISKLLNL